MVIKDKNKQIHSQPRRRCPLQLAVDAIISVDPGVIVQSGRSDRAYYDESAKDA